MIDMAKRIKLRRAEVHVYPSAGNVFNALRFTPFEKTLVVIVGQDPYHTPNVAHGLSFSSLNAQTPPSLLNIFKEIQRSLYPHETLRDIFPHPEQRLAETNYYNNDLTWWAKQGVLLLNRILTVEQGIPLSHKGWGWETFTDTIISKLNESKHRIVFMLWGKQAQEVKPLISSKHLILETSHPSPMSVNAGFNGCDHFKLANDVIRAQFGKHICWHNNKNWYF